MDDKIKNKEQNNNSEDLIYSLNNLQNGQIKIKKIKNQSDKNINSNKIINNNNNNLINIEKDILNKKSCNNIYSILEKEKKNYSARIIIEEEIINDIQKVYDNNSISYYRKNINKNKNCKNRQNNNNSNINDSNMSNFILIQKNPKKVFTDINALIKEKYEKETISKSKSKDNININHLKESNIYKPSCLIQIKKEQNINSKATNKKLSKKIKINNFINKKSAKYFLIYRKSKIANKCFICGSYGQKLFHAEKCNHFFCNTCGKNYFEQQINNCIYNLKCPKYTCYKHINIKIIKQFLSKFIYEKMIDNLDLGNHEYDLDLNLINNSQNINSSRERIIKNSLFSNDNASLKNNKTLVYNLTYQKEFLFNIDKLSSKRKSKKNLLLKKLTNIYHKKSEKDLIKDHFIKIGGSNKFNKTVKKINELKNIFCSQCNKNSLFPVKNKPFIKCLNCEFAICKFCYKQYDCYHLIRNTTRSCKVFFRTHLNGKNDKYIYFYQLLYIFCGLIILYIGFTRIEAEYLSNYNRNKIFWIYIIIFLILLFFNFIILIVFLPYYPLFLLIVEL